MGEYDYNEEDDAVEESLLFDFTIAQKSVNEMKQARKMEDLREDVEDRNNHETLLETLQLIQEKVAAADIEDDSNYNVPFLKDNSSWYVDFSSISKPHELYKRQRTHDTPSKNSYYSDSQSNNSLGSIPGLIEICNDESNE